MPTGLEAMVMEAGAYPPEASGASSDPVEAVLARIQGGDLEAFEDLLRLTERKVLSLAWRLLQDRDLARDAAQDVYLRVHRSLGGFRRGENFSAWLYRITVNVCNDHARKRGPLMAPVEALEVPRHAHGSETLEAPLLQAERRALVQRALDTLTPRERAALVLRDLEGLSTEEAASALGVRAVTVRSQISSARTKVQVFCARLGLVSKGGAP